MNQIRHFDTSKRYFLLTMSTGLLLLLSVTLAAAAEEQKKRPKRKGAETLSGTAVKVEKKGRTRLLTVKHEQGEEKEYILSSRTPITIMGKGDSKFFKPGIVVSTEVYKTKKNLLFGKEFTVHLDGAGNSRGSKPGKGKDVFKLIGPVRQVTEKEITLDLGRVGLGKVTLEKGYEVNLVSGNPDLIESGATVEIEGVQARGRFKTKSVSVTMKDPLDATKYFESLKKPNRRERQKIAGRSRKKSSGKKKGKTDKPTETKNPFADINKKSKDKKKDKEKTSESKK